MTLKQFTITYLIGFLVIYNLVTMYDRWQHTDVVDVIVHEDIEQPIYDPCPMPPFHQKTRIGCYYIPSKTARIDSCWYASGDTISYNTHTLRVYYRQSNAHGWFYGL